MEDPLRTPKNTFELAIGDVAGIPKETSYVFKAVPTETVPEPDPPAPEPGDPAPPVAETAGPKDDVPPGDPAGTPPPAPPPPAPITVTLTCVHDEGFVQVPGEVNISVCN